MISSRHLAFPAIALTGIALTFLSLASLTVASTTVAPSTVAPKAMRAANAAPTTANADKIASQRVLVLGGGPDFDNNQVAIESNVRYINRLLPPQTPRTVLFADGNLKNATVLYDKKLALTRGRYLYDLVFDDEGPADYESTWRAPQLGSALDGASRKANIARAFAKISHQSAGNAPRPLLIYTTGHGSQNEANSNDNFYDLWANEQLSVREMAAQIARLPKKVSVNLVMVQCFSGAFANLVFDGGDPKKALAARDIAGFFAATRSRVAAGCTSEVDEAEYHDFTSYFFAALCGRDRVGRRVTGADFNHDGRVGMDEAFCYTLANDKSIDTPVATSDLFLRHFVTTAGMSTRYATVLAAASPAQHAALENLSAQLKLNGENRVAQARQKFEEIADAPSSGFANATEEIVAGGELVRAREKLANLRHEARADAYKTWPDLRRKDAETRDVAQKKFIAQIEREKDSEKWRELTGAGDELARLLGEKTRQDEENEAEQAQLIRFVNLHDSVSLRLKLQSSRNAALKTRFARLLRQEASTPLPPVAPEN